MEIIRYGKARRQYNRHRFWELFKPNTITFSFWLATASFSFFAYQSISLAVLEGIMGWVTIFSSYFFLGFGFLCVLAIVYLGVTWLLGFSIQKKRTKEEELARINLLLEEVESRAKVLRKSITDIEEKIAKDE
jgi:hypothetical protein